MSLQQRVSAARIACQEALEQAELSEALAFLRKHEVDQPLILNKLNSVAETQSIPPQLLSLKEEFSAQSPEIAQRATLERAMLVYGGFIALSSVPSLPVDDSVKHLFCKEISSYACPPVGSLDRFRFGGYPFVIMSKIVVLKRFPAGQSDWEVSGMPRSWFGKISLSQLPSTLYFTLVNMRALKPYLVCHLAGATHRKYLLTEREFLRSFCRLALAVGMQPAIKGVMAGSWLHSKETHRVSPHLAFLNRPYLECGGHYFDAGPAGEKDGFLSGDSARASMYRSGEYKPTFGVVMCSREQILDWLRNHQDVVTTLAIRQ